MTSSDAQGDTLRFQRVYEHTPHILPSSILDPAFDISRITVTDLFGDGSAIILENLLTAEECSALKETGEKFGLQNCGYSSTIRVCDRVSAMGHEFAAELFRRALPFVSEVVKVKAGSRPRGVDDGLRVGEYKPIGLNPCFRVVRYHPGGFFFPHYDYGFEESASITSVKTFMMYLSGSEDFEGGPTRFFNEKQKHYVKPVKSNIVHSYAPLPGSCLIFNHHITHDGGNVLAGQKWLFRTELMYECELTEDQKIEDAFKQLVANVSDAEDSQKYEY